MMMRHIAVTVVILLSNNTISFSYSVETSVAIEFIDFNTFIDENGFLNFVGLVKNVDNKSGAAPFVKVILYNSKGEAIDVVKDFPLIQLFNTGYVSPFKIVVSDAGISADTFDFRLGSEDILVKQYFEPKPAKLITEDVEFVTDNVNITRITGMVRNSADIATDELTVGVAFIDDRNHVIDVKFVKHEQQIIKGETVAFDLTHNGRADKYCLVADSEDFVASPRGECEPAEIVTSTPPRQSVILSDFAVLDAAKTALREISKDQQILLQSTVSSNWELDLPFTYIVQVKDSNGITAMLAWMTGELSPGKSFDLALSWIPEKSGTYYVEIFVWKDITDAEPLSFQPINTSIVVNE